MRSYLFREPVKADDKRVLEFSRFSCVMRLEMGWPLIGVEQAGRLVSLAGPTEPRKCRVAQLTGAAYKRLKSCLGPDASARLEEFSQVTETHRPDQPHIYLGFIGTGPKAQGRGYGRALLDWTHRLSEAHAKSIGVALDTENPANIPISEHFSYRTVAKQTLRNMPV